MDARQIVDRYFMEHRAKIIDVAAFLDRVDRAAPAGGGSGGGEDFRVKAFRAALALLCDGKPQRAKRILELLSDQSTEPIQSAAGLKGAFGAVPDVPPKPSPVSEKAR